MTGTGTALRVGVLGAGGRMGREVCRAVTEDPELELVSAVDPALAGIDLRQATGLDIADLQVAGDISDLERAGAEVAVDFTVADVALANMRWCAAHGVHCVVGTTGVADSDVAAVAALFGSSSANCKRTSWLYLRLTSARRGHSKRPECVDGPDAQAP